MKNGRPPKERTGKRGRPPRAKTSNKAVQAAIAKNRGRNRQGKANQKGKRIAWNMEEDSPMAMEVDAR